MSSVVQTMVGDALLDIIFSPEENDGVGMLIGAALSHVLSLNSCVLKQAHQKLSAAQQLRVGQT